MRCWELCAVSNGVRGVASWVSQVVRSERPPEGEIVLTAMAHTDGDQEYEFGNEGGVDGPYVASEDCTPVTDDADVIIC